MKATSKSIACGGLVLLAAAAAGWIGRELAAGEPENTAQKWDLKAAELALDKAIAAEKTFYPEWRSLEMNRSATREIARSERERAEAALKEVRQAREALKQAKANQSKEEIAAVRKRLDEEMQTVREVIIPRLIDDSLAADKAVVKLLEAERTLIDKYAATRGAMIEVAEIEAEQAEGQQATIARYKLYKLRAEAALEAQQFPNVLLRRTAQQSHEMTSHAARIARQLAGIVTDPARKKRLRKFAETETERAKTAKQLLAKIDRQVRAAEPEIYKWRARMLGGLEPLDPREWDYAKARHLLVRAGFGGTPQEVQRLCDMGLHGAVDYLVEYYRRPAPETPLAVVPPVPDDPLGKELRHEWLRREVRNARRNVESGQLPALRRAWLERMVESPRPLQEKLALFWHGHFAAQYSKVGNSYAMARQNRLFREHAAGNFGALLYGIVHDPAMIRYLDNHTNAKGHANENLAREIMELFAMGAFQGYDEKDVREVARALTGYTLDNRSGQFRFRLARHDAGEKTIFGRKGPWTGDDVVRLILEQPSTSRFIARKLFAFFAYQNPDEKTVDKLATVLRGRDYELEPMLKNLFLSKVFYSEQARGQQIKSPVQLVVGTLRDLGVEDVTDAGLLDGMTARMGQQLFQPPDVKGWRYGRAWISTERTFDRYNTVAELIRSIPQPDRRGVDLVAYVRQGGCENASEVVDYLARACLTVPLSSKKRRELAGHLGELPPSARWDEQREALNQRLQNVLILMTSMPEYQVM